MQGMALLLLVFVASSITLGWLPTPWWTSAIGPTISLLGAVYSVMSEPPNYDMHGFGYVIGAVLGVACLVGWLAARGVRWGARHYRNRGEQ